MSDLQIGKIEQLTNISDKVVISNEPPAVQDLTNYQFVPQGFLHIQPTKITMKPSDEDIMRLAEYAHAAWAGWMDYLFNRSKFNDDGSVTIPKELVTRWLRQCVLTFKNLPESEKLSDIEEAKKIWNRIHGQD